MTRTLHDSFAKDCMKELLSDFGDVETEKQITGEVREIDLFFQPHPTALEDLKALGLLGRMVSRPAILEPFRNAVPQWDICNCREKRFRLEAEFRRQANQKAQKRSNSEQKILTKFERPFVWILTPTFSQKQQDDFLVRQKKQWGQGIYFLAEPDLTAVVAIHHLPKTLDTLFLRLLGREQVQADAVKELLALPPQHPYRQETLRHISVLQINLQLRQNKTKDSREVIMNLAPAYDKWLEETLDHGRGQGRQEIQVSIARRLLQRDRPLEEIAQDTGLSIEVLEALRSNESPIVNEIASH